MAIYILYTSQCLYFNYVTLIQYMEKPREYPGEYCSLEPPEGQYSPGSQNFSDFAQIFQICICKLEVL